MSELVSNGVQIYQFPTDDETVADLNSTMNVRRSTMLHETVQVKGTRCLGSDELVYKKRL